MGSQVVHCLILIPVRREIALIQILNHMLLRARISCALETLRCLSLVSSALDNLRVEVVILLVLLKQIRGALIGPLS